MENIEDIKNIFIEYILKNKNSEQSKCLIAYSIYLRNLYDNLHIKRDIAISESSNKILIFYKLKILLRILYANGLIKLNELVIKPLNIELFFELFDDDVILVYKTNIKDFENVIKSYFDYYENDIDEFSIYYDRYIKENKKDNHDELIIQELIRREINKIKTQTDNELIEATLKEFSLGGKLGNNKYMTYKMKNGMRVKKKIYIINGKAKVRDRKNNKNKVNYISLTTYKKKYP